MEFPPQSCRLQLQNHPQHQLSTFPCDFFTEDVGRSVEPFEFLGAIDAGGQDCAQALRFSPSCDVLQLVPGPIPASTDAVAGGTGLLFDTGVEPKRKRPKERDAYLNESQVNLVDYLQLGPVSSGLRLSLGIDPAESSGNSTLLPSLLEGIEEDLRQQNVETDMFINYEMEQLRRYILEKVHCSQLEAISLAGVRYHQNLRHKDAEIEILNRRNKELEDQVQQLTAEASAWRQRAIESDSTIVTLQAHLEQAYARYERKVRGDSGEADETASCNLGERPETLGCRACWASRACMVVHPCGHLCLCKACESRLSYCPLCGTPKSRGVEVYLP
ncbi:hypothetical protein MLD38_022316 [Melastoma candidum]|uniref:Uncharacterized protein n=1 Tax=Melastoma candidum TaxID=119954 RepID=A0ACB9QIW9_9MYRT|nr:hypothetical protein MLD38_022316 [Melastoma candidum]